jgi:hypothetical protein
VARYGNAFGIACLVSLTLAFFWRAALLRGYLVYGDIVFFFEPAKALLHDSLRAGRLPLWSPWIFAGYPIAAEGQIAAFYPVSLLVSWVLPSFGAVNWLVILHVMLAGVSMYLLARLLGASPFGAWLAGLVYGFSGFGLSHIHHISLARRVGAECRPRGWLLGLGGALRPPPDAVLHLSGYAVLGGVAMARVCTR